MLRQRAAPQASEEPGDTARQPQRHRGQSQPSPQAGIRWASPIGGGIGAGHEGGASRRSCWLCGAGRSSHRRSPMGGCIGAGHIGGASRRSCWHRRAGRASCAMGSSPAIFHSSGDWAGATSRAGMGEGPATPSSANLDPLPSNHESTMSQP